MAPSHHTKQDKLLVVVVLLYNAALMIVAVGGFMQGIGFTALILVSVVLISLMTRRLLSSSASDRH